MDKSVCTDFTITKPSIPFGYSRGDDNPQFDNVNSYRAADAELKEWVWEMLEMVATNPVQFKELYRSMRRNKQ